MEPRIQYAQTEDGVSIAYWTLGEGEPLVYMADALSHIQIEWEWPEMRAWYEQLARNRKLVRFDPRGMGLSERDIATYGLEERVLDLDAVAAKLGLKQFALFGSLHSGPVAIAYAVRHPKQVTHLILWSAYAKGSQVLESPRPRAIIGLAGQDWELYTETVAQFAFGCVARDVHTILFTDMESSTALRRRLGDAQMQEVVRAHNTIVRDALKAHGGSEIKHTGDGIMASFSTASSALECAIAIQRGVAAHVEEHPDVPLGLYIGLNAGEPIAEDLDLFGTSVDLAKRICDHAEAGEILASNVVRELAAGKGFLFSDRGETALRGFEDPVRLYEVRWKE